MYLKLHSNLPGAKELKLSLTMWLILLQLSAMSKWHLEPGWKFNVGEEMTSVLCSLVETGRHIGLNWQGLPGAALK